jgi:drug/metabolite transporter (DMT)-like permease
MKGVPVALLLGVLVRGETVAALSVVGGGVCLAGAWLMRRAQLEYAVRSPALRTTAYTQVGEQAGG